MIDPDSASLPWRELRKLHRGLANAPDEQIAQVVAVVDALDERGDADNVIAPLRPRLAMLRPRRPMRFTRLLFMPLDALIVPAPAWKQSEPTIPRTALVPLADMVRAMMGDEARTIDAAIQGQSADSQAARDAGRVLWPTAAHFLLQATQPPENWAKSMLPAECFAHLAHQIGTLLGQIGALHALYAEAALGVVLRAEPLQSLIKVAAEQDAKTAMMMVTLLLERLSDARQLLGSEPRIQLAIRHALRTLADRLENRSGVETLVIGSDLGHAGDAIRRILALLEGISAQFNENDAPPRVTGIAQRLHACCRLRFATALEVEFASALREAVRMASKVALASLESVARGLRELAQEASRVGSRGSYDLLLRKAANMVCESEPAAALGLVDRVRLVEILVGPDEALALLEPPVDP